MTKEANEENLEEEEEEEAKSGELNFASKTVSDSDLNDEQEQKKRDEYQKEWIQIMNQSNVPEE